MLKISALRDLRYHSISIRNLVFIFCCLFLFVAAAAEPIQPSVNINMPQKCKEIVVSIEVTKDTDAGINDSTLKINLSEVNGSDLIISLVGPKKIFIKDIRESEIKNLTKGSYSLVLVGREESSGYCPKQIQVLIN